VVAGSQLSSSFKGSFDDNFKRLNSIQGKVNTSQNQHPSFWYDHNELVKSSVI